MIGDTGAGVGFLIATINGTRHAIVASHGRARAATVDRIAGFLAVAILAVAAKSVAGRMGAGIGGFVATVDRATNAIVTNGRKSRDATFDGMADLRSVAIGTIAASVMVGRARAGVNGRITDIDRTGETIVADWRRTGQTSLCGAACFHAVAEDSVPTRLIIWNIHTSISLRIAGIDRAGDAVVAAWGRAGHAGSAFASGHTVAEVIVFAMCIRETFNAHIGGLIAIQPRRTGGQHPRLAAVQRIADLDPVTEQSIVAGMMNGIVYAGVGSLVARIGGAIHTVIADNGNPCNTTHLWIAHFHAVAELTIIA